MNKTARIFVAGAGGLVGSALVRRAEHWVVVRGKARIVCDEDVLTRTANQSVYIPIGAVHRLENPGEELLEIIEVQTGSYLGEDDIERLDDRYGR